MDNLTEDQKIELLKLKIDEAMFKLNCLKMNPFAIEFYEKDLAECKSKLKEIMENQNEC